MKCCNDQLLNKKILKICTFNTITTINNSLASEKFIVHKAQLLQKN